MFCNLVSFGVLGDGSAHVAKLVGIVAGCVMIMLLVMVGLIFYMRRRRLKKQGNFITHHVSMFVNKSWLVNKIRVFFNFRNDEERSQNGLWWRRGGNAVMGI